MRRFVILVAVFALGAGLLWYFERQRIDGESPSGDSGSTSGDSSPIEDRTERQLPPPDELPTDTESGEGGEGEDPGSSRMPGESVAVYGPLKYSRLPRAEGDPFVRMIVKDAQPIDATGTRYEFTGVAVDSLDPGAPPDDPNALRRRILAERSELEVDERAIGSNSFQEQSFVEMFDVVVEELRGTPFAPLTIESARLDVDLGEERLTSPADDVVHFRAHDARGTGVGIDVQPHIGVLSFQHSADFTIELGSGRVARVTTPGDGPLVLTEKQPEGEDVPADGVRHVEIAASNGVHAELLSREADPGASFDLGDPIVVDASSMVLDIDVPDGDERPVVQFLRLGGDVTIRHGRDTYRGDTARVVFKGGQPREIVIDDSPRLTYSIEAPGGEEITLDITGAGPVTGFIDSTGDVDEADRAKFLFAGPGRITSTRRGGVLTFQNEARGQGRPGEDAGVVVVSGDVRVQSLDGTLDSESIVATFDPTRDLRVASEGPTRIVGSALEDGSTYLLTARGGLNAHLEGERWYVDRAEDVTAESPGPDPYRVSAGTLTDVDVEARTFTALGNIDYESLWGKAFAETAVIRRTNSVELVGTTETPVQIDLVPEGEQLLEQTVEIAGVRTGWIRAVKLELTREFVLGRRGVTAQLETPDGVWGFDTEELDARRAPVGDGLVEASTGGASGPGQLRPAAGEAILVEARFVREARFDTEEGNAVVRADRVILDATATSEPGTEVGETETAIDTDRPATIVAIGNARVRVETYTLPKKETPDGPEVAQSWVLDASSAEIERGPRAPNAAAGDGLPFHVFATEVTECRFEGGGREFVVSSDELEIDGSFEANRGVVAPDPGKDPLLEGRLSGSSFVARGHVDLAYREAPDEPMMRAKNGASLIVIDGERGRLEAEKGKRVRVTGELPGGGLPYTMTASVVTFDPERITAQPALIDLPEPLKIDALGGAEIGRIQADVFDATEETLRFEGNVIVPGEPGEEPPFEFEDRLILDPRKLKKAVDSNKTIGPNTSVRTAPKTVWVQEQDDETQDLDVEGAVQADGWFKMNPGGAWTFRGRDLSMRNGVGARDASIVNVEQDVSLDAEFVRIDLETFLLQAGRGAVRGGKSGGWSIEFAQIESQRIGDEVMFVIVAPRLRRGADAARADYLAFWVDADMWRAYGKYLLGQGPKPDPKAPEEAGAKPNFLAEILFELQSNEYGSLIRALYMEGGVEVARQDRRAASGSKLYMDLPKGIAWLQDAELVYPLMSRGQEVPLRVRTERLETDTEGRLVADGATLTTCDHDVPHFVVGTKRFSLEPRPDGHWRFGARGNRLRFTRGVTMPLPSIGNLVLDEEFGVEGFENEAGEVTPLRDIGIAQTARFGTVLGAAFRTDIGGVGSWIGERLGMRSANVRGKWDTEAQYLWDRGPLGGLGLALRERKKGDDPNEDFRLDMFVGGIPDQGDDRGSVRVLDEDRDELRVWGWMRARYPIVRGEWIDFAVGTQTDAGVQAEFYEAEWQRFEQRDTFVRWRKSFGPDYLSAGAQKRIDDFRSEAEELPSIGAYRGEREVGRFTGIPVLWGGSFDAGYYTRREGELGRDVYSDLPEAVAAPVGNDDLARADLRQFLSLPIATGIAGIKLTPNAELRGTSWTSTVDEGEDDPVRGAARLGVEMSTTLHKVTRNGYLHALAPRASISNDVWYDEHGGRPADLDRVEEPIDGLYYDFGMRGLWQRPATFENLDVDVRAVFRQDREGGAEDIAGIATLAEYITRYGSGVGQIGLRHDGRYDLDGSNTEYSRSAIAIRPNDSFVAQVGYGLSRGADGEELFQTANLSGRWRVDPKWEFETRYNHDLQENRQLLTEVTLRRFGHDFVFDLTVQHRAGEGGTTFSFSLAPLLGWSYRQIGMLDRRR